MIHCIGDSHSAVFSGEEKMQPIWPQKSNNTTPYFNCYRIGAATAYQLTNKEAIINQIINMNVNNGDKVLFCFGEVDIRAHLKKQMDEQSVSVKEIVKICVDRYFNVLLMYKKRGIDVLAWGPIASWHESKIYTGGPSFGTNLERNELTKEFNNYLQELCLQNDIGFVSIFEGMIDDNNITIPEYLDNWEGSHIHLSQTAFPLIIKAFEKQLLI